MNGIVYKNCYSMISLKGEHMALPSLNTLRTFEAAARLESFNLASQELFITPSAVSHQMRLLESKLAVKLFIRSDKKVRLSADGERYYPKVKKGLKLLINATEELIVSKKHKEIKIAAVPFFATRWLMPKLTDFYQLNPDWQLKINTSTTKSDFKQEELDLVIRRGGGQWSDMESILLYREQLTPVCSSKLAKNIVNLESLSQALLLHNSNVLSEWSEWFTKINNKITVPATLMTFQNTSQILEACIAGTGVALIDPRLIKDKLQTGELVKPLDIQLPSERNYYLVYPEVQANSEPVTIFKQWIFNHLNGN